MPHGQRERNAKSGCRKEWYHLRNIARENIGNEFTDIIVNGAAFFGCRNDRVEIIVGQNHIGGFLRHIRADDAHGNPNIRFAERGRVVDAIAGDSHHVAACLKRRYQSKLMIRRHAGKDDFLIQRLLECDVVHRVHFRAGNDRRIRRSNHPDATRQRFGGQTIIAGDHHDAYACLMANCNGAFHLRPRRIHHGHQTKKRQFALNGFRRICTGARRQTSTRQCQHA